MRLCLVLFLGAAAMQDPPKKRPLEEALARGLAAGGNLEEEVSKVGGSPVRTKEDALALVNALAKLPVPKDTVGGRTRQLRCLAGIFGDIDKANEEAIVVLMEKGVPELSRLYEAFEAAGSEKEASDLLLVLSIIAVSRDGIDRVVRATAQPFLQESYAWSSLFSQIAETPLRDKVFGRLRTSLPRGFAGIAFLDSVNEVALKGDLKDHVFDSDNGKAWLKDCLGHQGENASYACSAATALPFISNPERDRLLATAAEHPDVKVRIQAAWAMAKVGKDEGIRKLAEYCKDLFHSEAAQSQLEDLGRKDAIPKEVFEPEFAAKSDFANWLSHPNELGRPPDRLDVIDKRELRWPGKAKPQTYWLIRYSLIREDGSEDASVGIAGPSSWCSFWDEYVHLPPADIYGAYAARDVAKDLYTPSEAEITAVVARWRGARLEGVRIREINRVQQLGQEGAELVGVADATLGGKVGWAVFDGDSSAFYDNKEFPQGFWYGHVLSSHIGRRVLGLANPTDRAKWASRPPLKSATPELIIRSFERKFEEAKKGTLTDLSPTVSRFATGLHQYARTLGSLGRGAELKPVLAFLDVKWKAEWAASYHLGNAAYEAGLKDLALPRLEASFNESKYSGRGDDASILAILLADVGRHNDAKAVLLRGLRALMAEAKDEKYLSTHFQYDGWLQGHRSTFLKLFPDTGAADLAREGIPADLLPASIVVPGR